MEFVLGIDAAWTTENPSGVALVGVGAGRPTLIRAAPSFEDFILGSEPDTWGGTHRFRACLGDVLTKSREIGGGTVAVMAVDMPLGFDPVRGRRCCDNDISRTFGARGCSTHSPTQERPGKVSDALYEEAREAGFALKTVGSDHDGAALLEVYPHVALLSLCQAGRRLPYKLSRRQKNFPKLAPAARLMAVKIEWIGILNCLKRHIDIDVDIADKIETSRAWKAWEDVIDALVCCWVGIEWLSGRVRPFGDAAAAIWVPEESNDGKDLA